MGGARKSASAMSLYVPEGDEQALQQFVCDSPWDCLDVRWRLVKHALAMFPDRHSACLESLLAGCRDNA